MDQRELYNSQNDQSYSNSDNKGDSLYFEKQNSNTSSMSGGGNIFGSSLKKISSNILLDSEHAKSFTDGFVDLYKEACRQTDAYTLRDERLDEKIKGQRVAYRVKLYITALFISFLPILITGFETFSSVKYLVGCTRDGKELELSQCVKCNGDSFKYEISLSYNIMVYVFWGLVVLVYYIYFYCVLMQSKFIMSMFSFQFKIVGNTASAIKHHWIGFLSYTIMLCLAIVFNKIVRLYAQQDDQTATCPDKTTVNLTITGDNYTMAQYVTSLILTILFSFESYSMIFRLSVEPSYSYFSALQLFHSTYNSDTSYIVQQISKITKELHYTQFCQVIKETAAQANVNFKLPFTNELVREAILLVAVLKINRDKLYITGK